MDAKVFPNIFPAVSNHGSKIYSRPEIYRFTGQEICDDLDRAIFISLSETEGTLLSDRSEPWLELFRPISHNVATRIFYWPEMAI